MNLVDSTNFKELPWFNSLENISGMSSKVNLSLLGVPKTFEEGLSGS